MGKKLSKLKITFSKSCFRQRATKRDGLIGEISQASKTEYGDELIKFMDTYGLNDLQSATRKQLQEYIANNLNKGAEK